MIKIQSIMLEKEKEFAKRPGGGGREILKEIRQLQEQIVKLMDDKIFWNLKRFQQKGFEGANKSGCFLAAIL